MKESTASNSQTVVLKPKKGWMGIDLKEIWRYKELIYFLTWRDIKVRYKQAVLGFSWAVLQPVITALVTTFVFSQTLNVKTPIPYPLFMMAAYLPWHLFSNSMTRSSTSLVANANLLTKVYFPRVIIPLASVLAALVDFVISFLILLGLMVYYKVPLTLNILWILPFTFLAMLAALTAGLWFGALNVQFRDVQQMVPFIAQVWQFLTPVLYPITIHDPIKNFIYNLNPMVGVVNGFRWAITGGTPPDLSVIISMAMVLVLFVTGLMFFHKMEKTFADVV
ncbi:MAG: ABC transporter permease [Anaerolineaceae bacterium]|nr:ABC transporter permease [Anaerolineaceae bacterium]